MPGIASDAAIPGIACPACASWPAVASGTAAPARCSQRASTRSRRAATRRCARPAAAPRGAACARHERGHLDRLRVVADHPLHEAHVGVAAPAPGVGARRGLRGWRRGGRHGGRRGGRLRGGAAGPRGRSREQRQERRRGGASESGQRLSLPGRPSAAPHTVSCRRSYRPAPPMRTPTADGRLRPPHAPSLGAVRRAEHRDEGGDGR